MSMEMSGELPAEEPLERPRIRSPYENDGVVLTTLPA